MYIHTGRHMYVYHLHDHDAICIHNFIHTYDTTKHAYVVKFALKTICHFLIYIFAYLIVKLLYTILNIFKYIFIAGIT